MVMIFLSLVSGCTRPALTSEPIVRTVADGVPGSIDRQWEAAREVLRRHIYEVDLLDRRSGVITTRPITSQSVFEFWRHDVDTPYDLLESTLNPIRRRITIRVATTDPDGSADIEVIVTKERLSRPERQYSSSTQVVHFFGDSLPGVAGEIHLDSQSEEWIALGRDSAMEAYLADQIVALYHQP